MAPGIYISHMPQESGIASLIRHQFHNYSFEHDLNSPNIRVALFVLTYGYINDPTTEDIALSLLNRRGVWCIPLFYHLDPDQLGNMCRTEWAKSFWKDLKHLSGIKRNGTDEEFVNQIVQVIGLHYGGRKQYDVFLCHAGETKPFCKKLKSYMRQQCITCFLDVDDLTGGPNALPFSEEIRAAIRSSKVVVAILSHHFVSKAWPVKEILEVLSNHGKALPVYYHVSRDQFQGIEHYAQTSEGRDALAWLLRQPGIEHFGKHAGEQRSEQQLMQEIALRVSDML